MPKKERVVFIFLLILSAFLLVFIGLQIAGYYKSGRAFTEKMRPGIECTGYIYTIRGISYSGSELTLSIYNQGYSDYEIEEFTVQANQTYTQKVRIPQGTERQAKFSIRSLPDEFTAYPENCFTHAKKCSLRTAAC